MELEFINCTYKEKPINIHINKNTIIGITGNDYSNLIDIIALKEKVKGKILSDKEQIKKDNVYEYRRKISIVPKEFEYKESSILNVMIGHIKRNNLRIKEPIKKIKDSLKIVELNEEILYKSPLFVSTSEKKLIQIAISLLSNPNLIILDEPFKLLDKFNEKIIILLLQRLKEQFSKTIIICSNDSNRLYKYTDEMIFVKNDEIVLSGLTKEVYLKVDYLKNKKFEIPEIVDFTYRVIKHKNVKIDYHKDVRDIIKDIYKHV